MTVAPDDAFPSVHRPAATLQKLASVALCLVAVLSSGYAALNGVWSVSGLFLAGLVLAVQSYRAVEEPPLEP